MNKHQVQGKSSTGAKSAANADRGRQRTFSQSPNLPGAAQLMQLQKAAGNRAVAGMLRSAAGSSNQPVAQMDNRRFRPKGDLKPGLADLNKMAEELDKLTLKAHELVVNALKTDDLGSVKNKGVSTGHYSNWLVNTNPMTTGYVIEDMVTSQLNGVPGYASQVTYGNARPDFVITDGAGQSGVVDITTAKEAGHVLDKDFNINSFDYVSESLYPSINFNDFDASFTFSDEDRDMIQNAQQRKGEAKLGTMLNQVKQQLDLRADQSFVDQEMSEYAQYARNLMKSLDPSNQGEVAEVDDAIYYVNQRIMQIDRDPSYISLVSDIIAAIEERYFSG